MPWGEDGRCKQSTVGWLCCVPVLAAVASGVVCTGKLISSLSCLHLLSIGLDDEAVKCQHLVKTIAL